MRRFGRFFVSFLYVCVTLNLFEYSFILFCINHICVLYFSSGRLPTHNYSLLLQLFLLLLSDENLSLLILFQRIWPLLAIGSRPQLRPVHPSYLLLQVFCQAREAFGNEHQRDLKIQVHAVSPLSDCWFPLQPSCPPSWGKLILTLSCEIVAHTASFFFFYENDSWRKQKTTVDPKAWCLLPTVVTSEKNLTLSTLGLTDSADVPTLTCSVRFQLFSHHARYVGLFRFQHSFLHSSVWGINQSAEKGVTERLDLLLCCCWSFLLGWYLCHSLWRLR